MVPPAELIPKRHPKNPNTHSTSQISAIATVIDGNGWRAPITVSSRSGLITRGHGRLEAALLLGCVTVPVDNQDYATEADEIADMIADNHLAEMSEMDDELLIKALKELQDSGHNLELSGFSESDLERLGKIEDEVAASDVIPKMEIMPFEHHDYLVFMFHDIRDWLRVVQLLGVTRVDYSIGRKCPKIGVGRVLNGKHLLRKFTDQTCDHVPGASPTDHDTQTGSEGDACGSDE